LDLISGFYDLRLELQDDDGNTIKLLCHDISNLSISKFGGGLTQLMRLCVTDVSENQLDRVAIHITDLEHKIITFDCLAAEMKSA
jgi:hypothetical protein